MRSNFSRKLFAAALLLCLAGCAFVPPAHDKSRFAFAMIGDLQYNQFEETHFPPMLDAISREPLAFVVHVGDFKAGSNAPCTDALFTHRRDQFNRSVHAFIYTTGDNDWVDCRRPTNGAMDPLARLEKLREIFFENDFSLGKNPFRLTRQSETFKADAVLSRYRENAMWVHGGVVFATVNVQGSNDNVGFDAASDAEQALRTRANIAWLKTAVARARRGDIAGLAIFLQANPGFESTPDQVAKSAFMPFLRAFEAEAVALGKPILFAHGDSHQHRIDRPYQSPIDKRVIRNVTRVEGYGTPNVNWLRITVDPANRAALFSIASGNFVAGSASPETP